MDDLTELVESGVDLDGSLRIVAARGRQVAETATHVHQALRGGSQIADALWRLGCPEMVVGMVRVGELTGELGRAIHSSADYLTRRRLRMERLRKALAYPVLLAVLSTVVVYILDFAVLPDFQEMYQALGVGMSPSMVWWVHTAVRVSELVPGLLLASLAGVWLLHRAAGRPVRRRIATILLGWRWARGWMQYYIARRVWEVLSFALNGGMDLLAALHALERSDEMGMADVWREVVGQVEHGLPLSAALQRRPEMPEAVLSLLHVAEHTGDIALGAKRIYRHLDGVVERTVDRLLEGIEPVATIILGGVVGGATLLFFYPMLELIRQMA